MQTRQQTTPERPARLLRRAEVKSRTGIFSNSQLYRLMSDGRFPRPVKLSPGQRGRAVAWLEHEVDAWIQQRSLERDTAAEA